MCRRRAERRSGLLLTLRTGEGHGAHSSGTVPASATGSATSSDTIVIIGRQRGEGNTDDGGRCEKSMRSTTSGR